MSNTETTTELSTDDRAELERLRADAAGRTSEQAAATTREQSARKPEDHKPKETEKVTVEFEGVTYLVSPKAIRDIRFLDLLEREQMNGALRLLLGEEKYEEFVKSITDEEGFADAKFAGELLEKVSEAAGAKNS